MGVVLTGSCLKAQHILEALDAPTWSCEEVTQVSRRDERGGAGYFPFNGTGGLPYCYEDKSFTGPWQTSRRTIISNTNISGVTKKDLEKKECVIDMTGLSDENDLATYFLVATITTTCRIP